MSKYVLVIEEDWGLYRRLDLELEGLLNLGLVAPDRHVICRQDVETALGDAKIVDFAVVVAGERSRDRMEQVTDRLARLKEACPLASFVVFAETLSDPTGLAVNAVVERPELGALAEAVNRLLPGRAVGDNGGAA